MSAFSPFVQALAKYRPYIKKEIPYILTFVYIFAVFVCMCVIFSMSLPPEYIVYAICSIILTVATALLTLCAHAHPIEELSYCVFVCALFALTSSSALIRTIYGEHITCSKLYDNDAASSALSDRLDELGSASGSVVSASLLNAEASQVFRVRVCKRRPGQTLTLGFFFGGLASKSRTTACSAWDCGTAMPGTACT
jgi:hypothetical protein